MPDTVEAILLVDDDAAVLRVCADTLSRDGHRIVPVACGQEALQAFAEQQFAAAVVDLVLPDVDGLTLLSALREADPDIVVVLMTGHASLDSAVDAVRRGAYDYLRKPFTASELSRVVSRALDQRRLSVQNRTLLHELDTANRDLTQKVKSATDELMAFISLGRTLDQAGGLQPVLRNLVRAAMQLTGATTAAILSETPTGQLSCLVAEGHGAPQLQALRPQSPEPLLGRVRQTHKPLIVPELRADPELATGLLALLGFSSALAVPLLSASGPVGTLILLDPTQPFTERQSSLVKVIAAQAAEVIALAEFREPAVAADTADDFIDLRDALGAN